MTVYRVNPLQDPRWVDLVARHPLASVFHTRGWLDALRRTYGFEPVALTTSAPGESLANGVVFCQIRSWLSGRRLVSMPFSDHCEPLVQDAGELEEICAWLARERQEGSLQYIELRPQTAAPPREAAFGESEEYCLHTLDLRPALEQLFRTFHRDSTQRKIRRADREGLTDHEGRSEDLLRAFYGLMLLTRRRHQLPPQPFEWFGNLAACMGPALSVRIASREGQAVAGIVTLRHRGTIVYKYGASDAALHRTGGMQLLFWKTIQAARRDGCVALDLGRSDVDQRGLIAFKDRWGAARSRLIYWRCPVPRKAGNWFRRVASLRARQALGRLPTRYQAAAGRILYRHVG